MNTKEWCSIQANDFVGAVIKGSVTIDDSYSGENFCGNAGDVTGHSLYENMVKNGTISKTGTYNTVG